MPDPALHASFGREVLSSLPPKVREAILPEPYTFALFGPDVWFMYKPWRRREGRGRRMHTTRPGEFLASLLGQAKQSACRGEMFSYLAGFFCHYALDSTTHPYIIHLTAEKHVFRRSHMSLEHALDAAEMRRDGLWGTAHPVTGHYFPALRLPGAMRRDLDAVYEKVYGWKNCWKDMNRSIRLYRRCFRWMENPRGLGAFLARVTGATVLRSLMYSESVFHTMDPENTEHRPWTHPFEPSLRSTESFADLRDRARVFAVSLIEASYRFLWEGEGTPESLSALIGDRSYLSGLPAGDPRNLRIRSLLPPDSPGGEEAP